jgi:hypothetical protein
MLGRHVDRNVGHMLVAQPAQGVDLASQVVPRGGLVRDGPQEPDGHPPSVGSDGRADVADGARSEVLQEAVAADVLARGGGRVRRVPETACRLDLGTALLAGGQVGEDALALGRGEFTVDVRGQSDGAPSH